MAPPANDDRATAQLVPVGSYWGVVLGGTTVDATEDAGGPVDGYGAADVFYTWSSLPAGNVYIYIQPTAPYGPAGSDTYFEAGTFSGSATSWTSGDGFPGGFGFGGSGSVCRFQHLHSGGPLTLVVYTYTPDVFAFDFGWGHDLDATTSHWGVDQSEDWGTVTAGITGAQPISRRGIKQTYTAPNAGTTVPAQVYATCAFENARDGVVDIPSPTSYGCSYIGPGPGTSTSGINDFPQDVGSYYLALGVPGVLPTTTGRSDRVGTEQKLIAVRLGTDGRGPVTEDVEPGGFPAYQTANEGGDQALVWGWDYTDATPAYETRNYSFGTYTVSDSFTGFPGVDTYDTVTPIVHAVPQAAIYNDEPTVDSAADRVWLWYDGSATQAEWGYVTPDNTGTFVASLPDGATTEVVIADVADVDAILVHSEYTTGDEDTTTARYAVLLFTTQETLDDTPPTFGDPPRTGQYLTIANRTVTQEVGDPSYESRLPTWRPYLGFPLVRPSGWRVGRVAAGNTPW